MAGSVVGAASAGRHRRRRRAVMSEINVTPFVDVMLVLLIVFMVSAPLLTVGVPLDLPQSQAKSLEQDREPLTISVNVQGQVFLQNSEIKVDDLVPKLKAVADSRGGVGREWRIARPFADARQSASGRKNERRIRNAAGCGGAGGFGFS